MKAYAKLNLLLRIIGKRPNGYHNLQMINCRISLNDKIKIKKIKTTDQVIYINSLEKEYKNDIILHTLKSFKEKYKIKDNFKIIIKKNIPVGAGLGGASMDASTIIKKLVKKYSIDISTQELSNFLLTFGADMPYGLFNKVCVVEGIGDVITPLDIKLKLNKLIMIYPNVYNSTVELFKKVTSFDNELSHEELVNDLLSSNFYNKFEEIVYNNDSNIKNIVLKLNEYGKIFMSGSGSTLFLKPNENIYKVLKQVKTLLPECKVKIIKIRKE